MKVAIVIIGRNEGERLRVSLAAARRECDRIVYVDSESGDGSLETAQSMGIEAVSLQKPGLTAARGRQTGFERLRELWPETEHVQFIDGDCELQPGWLERAARELERDDRIAAVSGIRAETRVRESVWSRLVDIEWPRHEGDVLYPGGDSYCRVSALMQIGGWSVGLIAGEDPDLGFRLTDGGWRVRRLSAPMTLHDIRISSFGQYWKRAVRSGYAYAAAGWRGRHGSGRMYLTTGAKFTVQVSLLAAAVVAGGVYWPVTLLAVAIAAWMIWRAARFGVSRGLRGGDAAKYAVLTLPVRLGQAFGFIRALYAIWTGSSSSIIEYRTTNAAAESATPS
jgi:glycosyltransferase involved in cell wall biosynthesis